MKNLHSVRGCRYFTACFSFGTLYCRRRKRFGDCREQQLCGVAVLCGTGDAIKRLCFQNLSRNLFQRGRHERIGGCDGFA